MANFAAIQSPNNILSCNHEWTALKVHEVAMPIAAIQSSDNILSCNREWTALNVHEVAMSLKVYTSVKRITSIHFTSNFLYTSLPCLRLILLGGLNSGRKFTVVPIPMYTIILLLVTLFYSLHHDCT